ncbi:MAG: menaquinol oxidoreductase [Deltaproteobacteria bacterium]|nr:menaquinol oxidoreductase [Deltaproteobacteria bacterium]
MNDKGMIIAGLIIFFTIFTFPIWYNHGAAAPPPEPELSQKAKAAKTCVEDTAYMRTEHMHLLNQWRNTAVRDGLREYTGKDGKTYEVSLSNTCLDCHSNKEQFCDRCHNYASVTPYCWDCHTYPKEKM